MRRKKVARLRNYCIQWHIAFVSEDYHFLSFGWKVVLFKELKSIFFVPDCHSGAIVPRL